jgi:phosphoglycolate phosphatase-like HAD superfamily hydrolase
MTLIISDIDGTSADSATRWYRSFTPGDIDKGRVEGIPTLKIPSHEKLEEEYKKSQMITKTHGQRIREAEHKTLHIETTTRDIGQKTLRRQRDEERYGKKRKCVVDQMDKTA